MQPSDLIVVNGDHVADAGAHSTAALLERLRLPHELSSLYEHVANADASFSLERLVFRPLSSLRDDPRTGSIILADERISTSTCQQWMYHRVDDVIIGSMGRTTTPRELLHAYAARESRQREQNWARYTEKCVGGRYCPTPELAGEGFDAPSDPSD